LEIALVMLELDYALEKDKPEAPCLELMVLMSLCRLTRRILPHGNLKIIKGALLRESWEQSLIPLMLRNIWPPLKKKYRGNAQAHQH
jgi:hypothetical protein